MSAAPEPLAEPVTPNAKAVGAASAVPEARPRPAIRLVGLDLDHTLTGPDLIIRPRVKEAVARTLARGVAVTIVTGRGVGITSRYAEELGLTAPLICFQGGLVYDYRARRVLHEVRLDPAVVPVVTRMAEQHGWNLQFETTTMSYLPRVSGHPPALLDLLRLAGWERLDNLATDLPETPYKFILTVNDPAQRDALAAELSARLAEAGLNLTVVPSHPILVEGLPAGLNKAKGLAWLAGYLGVAQETVLAVGDNDNDAPMLAWAGVGVAMGNGSPAALAAADWVAPSVADDGVAAALEKFALD